MTQNPLIKRLIIASPFLIILSMMLGIPCFFSIELMEFLVSFSCELNNTKTKLYIIFVILLFMFLAFVINYINNSKLKNKATIYDAFEFPNKISLSNILSNASYFLIFLICFIQIGCQNNYCSV